MKYEDLVDLSKRMVKEYYDRYVHLVDYKSISVDDVIITEETHSNGGKIELVLMVIDIDPWLEYRVIYNPKNKKKNRIISYVTMT
jgi:hypothetical protein